MPAIYSFLYTHCLDNYLRNKTSLIRSLRLNSYFPSQQSLTIMETHARALSSVSRVLGQTEPANVFNFYSHRCAQILYIVPRNWCQQPILLYATTNDTLNGWANACKNMLLSDWNKFSKTFPRQTNTYTYIDTLLLFVVKNHLNGWSARGAYK